MKHYLYFLHVKSFENTSHIFKQIITRSKILKSSAGLKKVEKNDLRGKKNKRKN